MRLFAVMLMLITACVVMAADERDDQWNDPALGVALATLDKKPPNIPGLQPFRWPTKRGMQAVWVIEGTPAYDAGLRVMGLGRQDEVELAIGDIVYQIGDVQVDSPESLQKALAALAVGQPTQIRFYKANEARNRRNQLLRINWQRKMESITPVTRFDVLKAQIDANFDEVTGVTIYRVADAPIEDARRELHCWLAKNETGKLTPYLGIKYVGTDWLFIRSFIFSVGNKRFSVTPRFDQFKRDNSSQLCWEWYDLSANPEDTTDTVWQALSTIRDAQDNVKVTYLGETYRIDRDVPAEELYRIHAMLDYFAAVRAK